jgi:hypothetical protein
MATATRLLWVTISASLAKASWYAACTAALRSRSWSATVLPPPAALPA